MPTDSPASGSDAATCRICTPAVTLAEDEVADHLLRFHPSRYAALKLAGRLPGSARDEAGTASLLDLEQDVSAGHRLITRPFPHRCNLDRVRCRMLAIWLIIAAVFILAVLARFAESDPPDNTVEHYDDPPEQGRRACDLTVIRLAA